MAQNKFFGADNLKCRARIDALNDGCLNCLGEKKTVDFGGIAKNAH